MEFSEFCVQLVDSGLVFDDVLGFGGGEFIEGINDGVSEFVQFLDDLSQDSLV